ncbi:MAG TPA: ribosome biogenesis GTPase YlqF [Bacilli bacterium]|nr:ribosome biogenesis GTPase YlqF [Bacilli bacterium]HOR53448.1 ribosome biogenesis GTPase YlqF [Bacilli bacterium]
MIQWYPGHMAKATKEIEKNLKLVDIVLELVDARIPLSSRNPELKKMLKKKPSLILLTKSTLADPKDNQRWLNILKSENENVLLVDAITNYNVNNIEKEARRILADKIKKDEAKGIKRNTIRMMIVGIPNVGKSTLINSLVKRKAQEAYNMPGVTKEVKWIRINENLDLLDTPGVLWPKFDDQNVAKKLALTRAIKDSIYQEQELSVYLLEFLKEYYPDLLKERYDVSLELCNYEILKEVALKRGFFKADEIDYDKAAVAVLADFRNMRIGRITLDK